MTKLLEHRTRVIMAETIIQMVQRMGRQFKEDLKNSGYEKQYEEYKRRKCELSNVSKSDKNSASGSVKENG